MWNDKRDEHGPLDIIGDIHGCCDELEDLLGELGYHRVLLEEHQPGWNAISYRHPDGRKAVFVGDLVDRGPRVRDFLSIVRNMMQCGSAIGVPGNHDAKLLRKLNGRNVQMTHGLQQSWDEIESLPEDIRQPYCKQLSEFLDGLVIPSNYLQPRL